ncbi:MAG: SprT-like domain-containing protein [Bacteroidales bacterium]|nr:SprT-like domain-containing protein [Bacteroidales bacterium]
MKPTVEYIKKKFDEYNRDMFSDKLPRIPIEIVNVKTYLGLCSFKRRCGEDGKHVYYDFKLSFNERLDTSEEEVQDTLIHEMIHYFIGYNGIEDATSHGPVFLSMMNIINTKFNRHLTVSHKSSKSDAEQLVDTRRHWHIVAAINLADGSFGIKVLPRSGESVIKFIDKLNRTYDVKSIDLYMSDEPYFNKFPSSISTKFPILDPVEPKQFLEKARHLIIHNGDIMEG